jgi:membrane glycosyltransferase
VATEPVDSSSSKGSAAPRSHRGALATLPARRVANYLAALGLRDRARLRELSHRIALDASEGDPAEHAQRAVAEAQARFEAWRSGVHRGLPDGVDPLWLRAFIGARPELFLGDVERAQRAALVFGDPLAGKKPRRAHFRPQKFERAQVPSWMRGLIPPALLTACAGYALWHAVALDGWTLLEAGWVGLFVFLFFLAAVGWSTAALGYLSRPRGSAAAPAPTPLAPTPLVPTPLATPSLSAAGLPRTALVMPIYHESVEDVFSSLAGMREALEALPGGEAFELFVLSDSRDPEICADEEQAFRRVCATPSKVPVYYHRRARNEHQKAGNLAEFFETWGPRYEYAVALDADSLMSATALVELVRRMQAEPKLALLQAPLSLHRAETAFARALQFSSSVCGPVFTRGLSLWAGAHGNYYGHNAAIRVSAFLDCCALPKLKGEPPFGGQVLSHDFVEAALLCRAGWRVRIAHDLPGGSYEELPPTLPEYVARDHRWCQGNLQHLRIAFMRGLRAMSRIHLLLGACAYLAAPAWLLFMVLGVLLWRNNVAAFRHITAGVSVVTLIVLLGPWLFGLLGSLRDPEQRHAHGGSLRLITGAALGVLNGALLAPLLMLHHTRIVLTIVAGKAIGWGPQQRRAASTLSRIVRAEWPTTLFGAAAALWLSFDAPGLLWWFAPLWLPWSLAIPISLTVSSRRMGGLLRRLGFWSVPSESRPEPLLVRTAALRELMCTDVTAHYRNLVLDPVLVAAHIARLSGKPSTASRKTLAALLRRALNQGPASLSRADWRILTLDAESMRLLHEQAWQRWPVESWDVVRDGPQVPPDTRREAAPPSAVPPSAVPPSTARPPSETVAPAPSSVPAADPERQQACVVVGPERAVRG